MTEQAAPEGYAPHYRKSAFTDPWEPLYSRAVAEQVSIGLWLRAPHCNSRGMVHGGLIAALADNAMGLSCADPLKAQNSDVAGLVTVSLNTDYLGAAKIGQWLATDTQVRKLGGSLCFADCLVRADGEPIARASATFKVLRAK